MIWFLLGVAVVVAGLYIYSEYHNNPLIALFSKTLASFCFIFLFAVVIYEKMVWVESPHYLGADFIVFQPAAILFTLALIAGLIGDILLALRPLRPREENESIILSGTIAFASGHVFYYFALLHLSDWSVYPFVFTAIMTTAIFFVAIKVLKFNFGKVLFPTIAYSFMIFLMIGQSFANAVQNNFNTFSVIIMIGAILFGISDLILSEIYFKKDHPKSFVALNLMTYYSAQILLALAFLFA
ncbi:MAG TPA: lysoplasmalogenase family protein [Bacillota bacterium]|nr:lysoplasmalogenase family protein [Bacillota bacterium]HPF41914.1 lysoplasmalogenase family protein [Bacillota bacterium]HPJ85613.1 lysoplasmalogenase family protein [Bacillota bacterium]HPQ61435.1 lysoplasmalogenase family protein [Bacillota bacterium]HRX91323.1 lysoplasmalogenase family protein [Candidatus Izemoplasmatales bacterium]